MAISKSPKGKDSCSTVLIWFIVGKFLILILDTENKVNGQWLRMSDTVMYVLFLFAGGEMSNLFLTKVLHEAVCSFFWLTDHFENKDFLL